MPEPPDFDWTCPTCGRDRPAMIVSVVRARDAEATEREPPEYFCYHCLVAHLDAIGVPRMTHREKA